MKIELICENCGGKRFDFRSSSGKLGGWDGNGERQCSSETYYCKKCMCPIRIEYMIKERKLKKEKKQNENL